MEIIDPEQKQQFEHKKHYRENYVPNNNGRIIGGIIIMVVGIFLFARTLGIYIPDWIMSWPMLVIAGGFLMGAKNSFRPGGWMLAVLIGGIFMAERFIPDFHIRPYIWPIILIMIGMFLIVVPSNRIHGYRQKKKRYSMTEGDPLTEDLIDARCVFAGVKKRIISKDFRGGDLNVVFGGIEINMTQADIKGKVYLQISQVFGGTELIVPSNWKVQNEISAVLGSVEDERVVNNSYIDSDKVLVLKGSSIFGGITIKSY